MQAPSPPSTGPPETRAYNPGVPRKLRKSRPAQGAHLSALRVAAGLSQAELANTVGETQQNIAYWEQSDKPPRSDVLPKLARALGVSVEQLLRVQAAPPRRKTEPVGKVGRIFHEVQKLPRRQQDKVIEVLSALLDQYRRKAS